MEAWKNSRELNKENARYVLTHIMNSYIIEEDYEKANKCKEFIDALDSPTANF